MEFNLLQDMLNTCFERPCSPGFAFHEHFPVQMDHTGAFDIIFNMTAKTNELMLYIYPFLLQL